MGTRAYRERERREHEKEAAEKREAMGQTLEGNIQPEFLFSGGVAAQSAESGVRVKTSLERREEVASVPAAVVLR
jgi:hypothetical protein